MRDPGLQLLAAAGVGPGRAKETKGDKDKDSIVHGHSFRVPREAARAVPSPAAEPTERAPPPILASCTNAPARHLALCNRGPSDCEGTSVGTDLAKLASNAPAGRTASHAHAGFVGRLLASLRAARPGFAVTETL